MINAGHIQVAFFLGNLAPGPNFFAQKGGGKGKGAASECTTTVLNVKTLCRPSYSSFRN